MKFIIETAYGYYRVLSQFDFRALDFRDADEILEYYHTHDVFSVSRLIYGSMDFIPKHAIQVIHIEEDDDEE